LHKLLQKNIKWETFVCFVSCNFLKKYLKEKYFVLAANSLISVLMPECQNGEGLLGALLAEGVEHTDVVRIVVDLCLAAGDTVSN
jgi:hypothetical protein